MSALPLTENKHSIERLQKTIFAIKNSSSSIDKAYLDKSILKIKTAYIDNWEKNNLPQIHKIVDSLDSSKGIPLPVLSVCGKGTQEIRYTQYLSYFLDPTKRHGLKNKLLKALLEPEFNRLNHTFDWDSNFTVEPEIFLGSFIEKGKTITSFADIGIISSTTLIVIEQKILSSESMNPNSRLPQLKRYNKALENNPDFNQKTIIKFYLTPFKQEKAERQGWNPLTHSELINRAKGLLHSKDTSQIAKDNLLRFLMDMAAGPYQLLEESLGELFVLGNNLLEKGFNLPKVIHFNRLVETNNRIIDLLMEV